jgi:hypothetical protein
MTEAIPVLDLVRIGDHGEVINRGRLRGHEYRRAADASVCLVLRFGGESRIRVEDDDQPYVRATGLPAPALVHELAPFELADRTTWNLEGDDEAFEAAPECEAAEQLRMAEAGAEGNGA